MPKWVDTTPDGTEVLMRAGHGVVVDVTGTANPAQDSQPADTYRLRLQILPDSQRASSVRTFAFPTVPHDSPLLAAALDAQANRSVVTFTYEITRKNHIPKNVPIMGLDLQRDVDTRLLDLTVDAHATANHASVAALEDWRSTGR